MRGQPTPGMTGMRILLALSLPATAFAVADACDLFGRIEGDIGADAGDVTVPGTTKKDWVGHSISATADLNGDGIADVVVSAHGDDTNGLNSGAVHVFYGPVNTGALDLALADVSMYGPSFGVKAGYAVSSAGDVDGDGFDDLLIGSLPSGNSAYKEGVAWLVRGSASLSGAVDLATQADATFEGPGVDYEFGSVVASAGDLNGDGNIDIAIGAPKDDTAADNAGAVYVFYSPALGSQSAASADLIITGDASVERVGLSLHSPGDVDGDGLDDLLIGAPRNDVNGTNSGTAYVWAGDATLSGTVGISGSMAALRGNFGNRAGSSLGSAGDVDNDGLADFWVGSKQFGGGKRGAAYLVSGADAVGDLLLPDIYEARLKGEGSSDLLGSSIFGNVDFDADGDMDVIVGAERADGGAIQSGAAYVVHGPFFGDIVVDPAVDGKISGYAYLDFTGGAVGAGDVNNDGFVDALVGSWKTEIAGPRDSGHVSIVFGGEDVQDEITWYADTDFDGYGDEKVTQISCDQPTGYVDVGGDCDDSSALFNPGIIESDCGSTIDYNCDGSVGLTDADGDGVAACEGDCDDDDDQRSPLLDELCFDDIDNDCDGLTDDGSAVDAVLWYPDSDNDSYGNDLAGVSSCEVPEFFIGAVVNTGGDCDDFNDDINPEANEVCDSVDNDCDGNIDGSDAIDALAWYPDADEDGYGDYASLIRDCVQPAGAVANAEDCDDTDAFTRPGAVEVCDGEDNDCDGLRYLGGPIAGAASFTDITSDVVNARLGQRVAFLADQNADGMGEIVAAAPDDSTNAQNAGVVYVMAGDFAGGTFEATGDFNDGSPRYMAAITTTRPTSELGAGLATGDFNNDGIADLAVGAPGMSRPRVDQGGVFVFFGPVMGDLDVEDADAIIGGPAQDSRMGQALATADLDGDGIDDLLVGAPGADGNGAESGVTYVFYGDALSGDLGAGDAAATLSGMAAGDGMGESVAVVGDVNNDGNVDIAAGAPYDSNSQAGYVDVVLGDGARFSGALSASFTLVGSSSNDSLGTSIAGMGDSNGDGFDDIALGSRDNSSYVWRGAASPASGDIESVGYARFDGALFASSGREVATAGDINRDGFADLLIGAHKDDEGADDAGAVYVVYGDNDWAGEEEATGLIAIELNDIESQGRLEEGTTEPTLSYTNANVPHGAKLMGDIIDGALGRGIAGNIDMNGDSFPDILAGEPGAFDDAGAARVFLAGPYGVDVVNTVAAGWSSGITVDGYATDWIGDIQFATSAGGDTRTAITWDDTNLYIGVEHPDVATGGAQHWVVAYIGNGDAGSTTGLLFNTQEPGLPFEATHAMRWKADDSYNGFATWDGAGWQEAANWLGTNGSEKAERNDESVAEFAIPLSEIGDPSTLSIVVHWVYEGAGFETSYAATPSFLYADASYDPDPAEYYAFNLAATTAPRFYGTLPSGGGIPGLEGTMTTYYADADLDGQVNAELLTFDACPLHVPMITDDDGNIIYGGMETTETATDCDDTDPTIYVGAPETANDGIDSDCDSFDNPNNIPVVTVNIEPNRPTTEDDLVAITNVTDADKGTPEETPINLTYTWTINGFEVPGQNSNTLSSIFFDRGQEVAVTVIANDRRDDSLPASDDVTVENTRPEFVFLQIVPQDPTRSDDLTLDFEIDDPDYLDFGLHTLDCQWEMQNGAVWLDIPGATNDVFENCATSGLCDAGDTIRADCYPVDSVERGVRFRTEGVTIRNVPPTLESCTVTPENPTERDDLIANASGVSETEGDTLTVSYEWRVDGVVIPQHTGAVYPWQDTRGHTTMEVICQVSDGFDTVRVSAGQFDIIDVRDADPVVNDTGDSGTTDTGNDCAVTFTLDALSWGNEIGFSVIDADSNVVYTALPGDFTAFSTTTFDLDLNPGDYTIELTDSFGDGWHGGTLTVTDGNGTASVFGADFLDGSLQVEDATFLCEPELCDMTVVMAAGSYGYEMSFDLVDADGNVVYTGDGYTSNLTSSETVELEAGTYSLELVDSFGDGWNGGELTITDGSGIAAVDAVTLLSGSTETLTDIELTCGDGTTDTSDTGSFGGPDDTAATCTITADLYTGSYGYEMGWTVSTLDGTEIYSVASGTYASFSDVVDSFDVAPGDYKIELTDTFGDGWNGATITLTDEAGNVAMDAESFTTGSSETFALTFSCEEVVDTDTDTDTDTDAGSVDCPEGQAVNCYGDCADLSTWGDGTCNNEWGDCSDALHDFGDCTEWGLDSCSVTVNVTTASFGNEVGWSLQAPNGAEIFGIDTGAYQSSTAYSFDIDVVEGDYVFVAEDSAGNGWGNGFFEIIGFDGSVVAAGTLEDGFEEAFTFSEDCGTEPELPTDLACELDVTIDLGSFPQEVGWLLTNEFGVGLGGVTSGTYTSGTESATTTIEVGQGGDFELQLFDSFGDGWNGGTYTITDPAGNILAVGTLEDGTIGSRNFTYLCDETLATGTTDSDACPEGEVEDCNGDCYPEAWLGDEWCDDGSFYSWGSPDFFCAAFDLDEGDCAVNIDDTSAVFVYDTANGCEIDLTYFSTIWGQEVSWDLYDQNGGLIGGAATGDYPSAGLTTTTLAVNPGTLTLVMYDSFGDGWNGGSLNITDVNGDTLTTATLESNGPTLGDGPEYAYFDVDCAEDTAPEVLDTSVLDGDCDVEIEVFEGTWGAELTFDLIDGNGDVVFNFGPYSNFTFLLYTYGVELADGDYTIAMSDSYGDGWNGGYVTVTHPNGTVLVDEATIFSGATGSAEFSLECAAVDTAPFEPEDTADYVFDTAGGCEVTWDLTTSIWASEIGWTIEDSTGSPVFESFANDYDSDSVYGGVLGLNPGTYTVTLTDDFGDGWNGAALTMTDSDGSTLMLDAVTLETGSETTFTVTTECPAVPDTSTPVDTFDSATVDTAPDGCDVDFELFGGSFGTEVSWAVLDEFGNQVFFGDGYTSNATFSGAFSVPSGLYTVEMYDSWGDGWNGASLTMTDINGNLLADGQTFTSGSVADFSITVDCAVDTSVGVDTDTDTDCTVDVVTDGGSFASEVSWTLTDALGTVVASGDGFSGAATITAPAGTYTLNMVDSWGDGWNGAT
ncbi:MAG: MopE-related protein, partial [Myxococcota bacterium]